METKFIGLEGFNEIESLPTKKRKVCRRELTTAQKTVRFVKRATTFCAKSVVRMSKNTAAKLQRCFYAYSAVFIGHHRDHVQLSESGGKWHHSQPSHSFFNGLLQTGWNMHELQIPHRRVLIFAINQ